jgi:NDP-sugar pyrophosphorylase family protein
MTIVIPMAGKGSRFLDVAHLNAEFKKPKPLIQIKGKPMICWAIESLPFVDLPYRKAKTDIKVRPENLVFICRQDHQDEHHIGEELKELFGKDIKVVFLNEMTRGATETVLKAKHLVDPEDEIIISDSDHHFDGSILSDTISNKNGASGIVPVFAPPDDEPKWSYTLYDQDKKALAVGEKDAELARKGAFANIGAYYFSKWKLFTSEAEEMIRMGDMYGAEGKKEFYIAPVYQRLIVKGHHIKVAVLPQVWGLGTPKDLQHFLEYYPK